MHKRFLVPVLLAAFSVTLSGCGSAVSQLSEEDQDKVAVYSAQILSKYNRGSDTGLVKIASQKSDDTEDKDDEKKKDSTSSDNKAQAASEQKSDNTGSAAQETKTLTDAIGISGMQFLYRDAKTASGYSQGDVYDLTADDGNELLVVRIKAENISKNNVSVDMPSQSLTFTATYGDDTVNSDMTLLMNDLTTYQGSFRAGKSRNMIILFQFPKGTVKDVDKVQYSVTRGDTTVSVNKDQSKKGQRV